MVESSPTRTRRRRLGRWAAVVCAIVAVLGVAGYGLLPWLVPSAWVVRRVETQLSALMQRPVTIERIAIGYDAGVVIEGLHMTRRDGFGGGPLLTVQRIALPASDRVQLPYDLLAMLWTGRSTPVSSVKVDGVACWIVVDAAGRLNIGDLNDQGGGVLPALAYEVADLRLHFADLRHPEESPGILQLPAFYVRLDPATGRMTWKGVGAFGSSADAERVNLAGDLLVPRLQRAVALAGSSEIAWSDVLLTDLPAALLPANLALRGGTSSGTLRIEATPQLDVLFALSMDLADVSLGPAHDPPLGVAALSVELQGMWSSAGRSLHINSLRCTAGDEWIIEGTAPAPVVTVDDRPLSIGMRLHGRMAHGERLLDLLEREGLDLHGWTMSGPGELHIDARMQADAWSGHLEATADAAAVHENGAVFSPAGVPKRLAAEIAYATDGVVVAQRVSAWLGASSLDFEGRLRPFEPSARAWLSQLERGRVVLAAEDVGRLVTRFDLDARLAGDVRVVVEGVRHERGLEIMANADLDRESRVAWDSWLDKSAGESVQVRTAWLWPGGDVTRFDEVRLELASAETRLAVSDGSFDLAAHTTGPVFAVRVPFDVHGLAGVRRLIPAVDRACGAMTVDGACRGTLAVNIAEDGQRLRVHAEVDAHDTAVTAREFSKGQNAPAAVVVDYHADPTGRSMRWSAELGGGRLAGHSAWDHGVTPVAVEMTADISAVGPFVAHWPRVAERFAPLELDGAARLSWQATVDATGTEFRAAGDFSATALCLEDGALCKPAGRALTLTARGRSEALGPGQQTALAFDEVEVRTAASHATWTGDMRIVDSGPDGLMAFEHCAGSGRVDWAVEDGLRFLADQREWGELVWSGRVAGHIDMACDDDDWGAEWVMDATELEVRTALFDKAAGAVAALAGHAGGDRFDAALHVATLSWHGADNILIETIDELVGSYHARPGEWTLDTRGGVAGGLLTGHTVRGPAPEVRYELSGASASPAAVRFCRGVFPSLHPDGAITYRIGPPHDNDPGEVVARGELIVDGGYLSGKAAPSWMATVFPRLNLAKFTFERMHDWYVVHEDGRVQHQAIFQGSYYHLYITGWQHAVGQVDYVVGIDLLAGQESPYWVEVGGGRIPLFRSVMNSDSDGNVTEESVNYVPLRFVKALLWESNPLYTAYHALRKRALGRE